MPLSNHISTTVTIDTIRSARAVFRPLIVPVVHTKFAERVRYFADRAELIALGFSTSDYAVTAFDAMRSQTPTPQLIGVGRRLAEVAQVVTFTIVTVSNSSLYTVTINGVAHNFTSDATALDTEIRDGLVAAINGGSQAAVVTAANGASNTFTVTSDVPGLPFTYDATGPGGTGAITEALTTASVGVYDDMVAMRAEDKNFYGLVQESRHLNRIGELGRWAEADPFAIYAAQSSDAGMLAATTTDPAAVSASLARKRQMTCYKSNDTHLFAEAWMGKQLPKEPGSTNWAWQALAGVTADSLTAAQVTQLRDAAKRGNWIESIGGQNVAYDGIMGSGHYVDVITGADKLISNVNLALADLFISEEKVDMELPGREQVAATIEAEIRALRGLVIPDSVSVTVPAPSAADIAARHFSGITFTARVRTPANKATVTGTLSL